ncbi:hypothetical protein A9P44_19090 [Paenibacillus polymyxa]|nr:hypothetical protein AV545_19315 [Paenibacillus jamilae]OBA04139.1 hypothetical protein A9P44_19090 [Paenibacillus polymyxa]
MNKALFLYRNWSYEKQELKGKTDAGLLLPAKRGNSLEIAVTSSLMYSDNKFTPTRSLLNIIKYIPKLNYLLQQNFRAN